MQNDAGTEVSDWHKIGTTETRFVPGGDLAKENPGALAGASEATFYVKAGQLPVDHIPIAPLFASQAVAHV